MAENESQVKQAKAQVAQVESDLARAMAIQVKTQLEVERYRPLAARGSISQQELDNAVQNNLANLASVGAERANLDKARANVERARGRPSTRPGPTWPPPRPTSSSPGPALAESQLNLGWTKVQSPITGMAGIKKASIGDLVGPTTVLTTVALIDPIYAQFNPSEQEYLKWREAEKSPRDRAPGLRADPLRRAGLSPPGHGRDPRPRGRPHDRAPSPSAPSSRTRATCCAPASTARSGFRSR